MLKKNLEALKEIFSESITGPQSLVYVGFLIGINFLLKFWNISGASIWCDEAHSVYTVSGTFSNLLSIAQSDQNPPFYNFILFFWTKIFGISEFGIRSLSVILSVSTAVVLYYFGRRFFSNLVGLFSSLLFTFSNVQLYYSHEARCFVLVSLLCLWSFWVFLNVLEKGKYRSVFILGILNALLLYTHFISVFVIVVQGVFVLWNFKKNRSAFWKFILSGGITVLLFSPWLINLLNAIPEQGSFWLQSPKSFSELFGILTAFYDLGILLVYTLGILVIFSLVNLLKGNLFREKKVLLFLWAFLPIVLCFVIAVYLTPVFLPRYLLYTTLGMYVLIAVLIVDAVESFMLKWLIFIPFIIFGFIRLNLNPFKGEEWKASVNYVQELKQENDVVVIEAWWQHKPFVYYFNRDWYKDVNTMADSMQAHNIYAVNGPEVLDRVNIGEDEKFILVLSHQGLADPEGNLLMESELKFRLIEKKEYDGVQVYVFGKREEMNLEDPVYIDLK